MLKTKKRIKYGVQQALRQINVPKTKNKKRCMIMIRIYDNVYLIK